jgi:hypothetical protein
VGLTPDRVDATNRIPVFSDAERDAVDPWEHVAGVGTSAPQAPLVPPMPQFAPRPPMAGPPFAPQATSGMTPMVRRCKSGCLGGPVEGFQLEASMCCVARPSGYVPGRQPDASASRRPIPTPCIHDNSCIIALSIVTPLPHTGTQPQPLLPPVCRV